MAVISPLASPINIKGVSKSVSTTKKSLDQTKSSFNKISEILVKKTKVRRQIFEDKMELKRKRENYTIRKEEEDRLEAPNIVKSGGPSQVLPLVQGSGRSFFGRILTTLGYLAAGWVLRNLPTWVALGKEFVARIGRAGEIIKDFVNNTISVFSSTLQLLDSFKDNLLQFDLFDSSNRVKDSFDELKNAIDGMGTELENAVKLVTTPLTQTTENGEQVGTYSGENVPGLGTTSENMGAYESSYTGPETSGGRVSSQSVYSYLRSKGMSHNHALGITANIKGESDFRIGVQEEGNSRSGVGLFQYSNVRKPAFLKAVPDYKTNWKAQIDYAINEDRAPEYLQTQFSSPEEAAYWWMSKWERPSTSVYAQRNKKHNDFIKSFKASGQEKPQQSQPSSPVKATSTGTTKLIPQTGPGGFLQGSSGKGMEDYPRYGVHFHLSPPNMSESGFLAARELAFNAVKAMTARGSTVHLSNIKQNIPKGASDAQIKSMILAEQRAHTQPGRTQGGIDIQESNPNVGPTHKGLPGSKIAFPFAVGPVSPLSAGSGYGREAEVIGSGGVKLAHGAAGSTASQISPSTSVAGPAQTTAVASPSAAQVSPAPTQQRQQQVAQQITPERKPQDIVAVIPEPAAAPPQVGGAAPSPTPSAAPSMSDVLNNFIKQKLLLDLAYL